MLTPAQLVAVVLFVAHTHAFAAADATAYLAIGSPEKRTGKTRLLEVLDLFVARVVYGRTTAAVLPRKIDAERPRCCSTNRTRRLRATANTRGLRGV